MVNGKRYAWEDVSIKLPHGVLVDVDSIEWEDEREVNELAGRGSRPVGWSRGRFKASGKLSVRREEYQRILENAGDSGIYGMDPFDITVTYGSDQDDTSTDTLEKVLFSKRKRSAKVDDKSLMVDLDFTILGDVKDDDKASFKDVTD